AAQKCFLGRCPNNRASVYKRDQTAQRRPSGSSPLMSQDVAVPASLGICTTLRTDPLFVIGELAGRGKKELTTPEPLNTCISIAILFKEHDRIAKIPPSDHAPHTHSPILNCPAHVSCIGPAQLLSR